MPLHRLPAFDRHGVPRIRPLAQGRLQLAQSSLRFSLGRFSSQSDVDYAIGAVTEAVRRLRRLAPAAVPG